MLKSNSISIKRNLSYVPSPRDPTHSQTKGGHIFPRAALGTRLTLVPTISYLPTPTSLILRNCKSNGVTIAHAVFALANISFIKAFGERDERVPMMLYSAMNLRPWLINGGEEDWFCIAIGYYKYVSPPCSLN